MLGYRRRQFLDPDAPLTFTLDLAAKDVGMLLEEADRAGVPAPQARAVLASLHAAIDEGRGGQDVAAMAAWVRDQSTPGRAP